MKGFFYLLLSFLCLLSGSVIYILYTPSVFFIRTTFSLSTLFTLQENLRWIKYIFSDTAFIRYHLSDILWYQSLLFMIIYIYHIKKIFHAGVVYYFAISLPFVFEILQLVRLIPGTFDWWDIFFYLILLFLNYFIYIGKKKPNEK